MLFCQQARLLRCWRMEAQSLCSRRRRVRALFHHSFLIFSPVLVCRYFWGWGHDVFDNADEPRLVKSLALHRALNNVKFVQVAAGGDSSLALTEHGSVWSFGGNVEGQCGFSVAEFPSCPVPQLLLSLHKVNVVEVACGGGHCMARTDIGSVLSWGRGAYGCLGHGGSTVGKREKKTVSLTIVFLFREDVSSKSCPTRVKALSSVTNIACGWSHSLCVDSGGKVRKLSSSFFSLVTRRTRFGRGARGATASWASGEAKWPTFWLLERCCSFFLLRCLCSVWRRG